MNGVAWLVGWGVACGPEPRVEAIALVPQPVSVTEADSTFVLGPRTVVVASGEAEAIGDALAEGLRPATGLDLDVVDAHGGADTIRLELGADVAPGGYLLDVDDDGVVIAAADTDGLFWGTQTLRQLLPAATLAAEPLDEPVGLPHVHIEDAPRFAWRGYMLDVARHFYGVPEVERQIDAMALHKQNRLHLHLTDDQGWRIEITSWPDLAAIGGATEVGGGRGGYYTQEEFAEIVAYAAARHVVVVPEVDFPAHCNAALASYPELNEDGVAAEPYTDPGVIAVPLWLEGPDTLRFVADVIAEVTAMTPGPWVHVGGDEADDISDEDYAAFMPWLQAEVTAGGKTMIGWDEIGPTVLTPPFVAQHWIDADRAVLAVAGGGQLIASPAEHAYLDMVHDEFAEFGQFWVGAVGVRQAYLWDPVPVGATEADVLGVEGALWTELVNNRTQVDLMTWPRSAGLAELGWSATTDWDDYRVRLGAHGARLEALGLGYYRAPEVDWTALAR